MIKVVVFSDSHGSVSNMCDIVEREQPDVVFHLGDVVRDADRLAMAHPEVQLHNVMGNCDYVHTAPLEKTVELEGCRFILCHGHQYYVKSGYSYLARRGQEQKASMILCGHTHRAWHDTYGSVEVFNPGSVGTGSDPTYGVLLVMGETVVAQLRHVYEEVTYHAANH